MFTCIESWWEIMCKTLAVPATVTIFIEARVPPNIVRCWMMARQSLVLQF